MLFDGFELLDVIGPITLLDRLPDHFAVTLLGPVAGPVRSSQGAELVATGGYRDAATPDIVMVPGGVGARVLAQDAGFLAWLRGWAGAAPLVTSVCTGSALLAAAGLLEGYRATSNKRSFGWAAGFGTEVEWVARARWVHDRDRWTSSGVAAGMDMTAALIAELVGAETAEHAAQVIELDLHTDPDWDPFAQANGLV